MMQGVLTNHRVRLLFAASMFFFPFLTTSARPFSFFLHLSSYFLKIIITIYTNKYIIIIIIIIIEHKINYRPTRPGARKRKSVRGCIVGPDISVLNTVVVKAGQAELPGVTDKESERPRRLGPKRASKNPQIVRFD